jgi:hypothetical protein
MLIIDLWYKYESFFITIPLLLNFFAFVVAILASIYLVKDREKYELFRVEKPTGPQTTFDFEIR